MIYHQKTGILEIGEHQLISEEHLICYSGIGEGKNNPEMESVHNIGPLPKGLYEIDIKGPVDTELHGPYVLTLLPAADNKMFGRSGFLIHGDSKKEPGNASHGCIVTNRLNREIIWDSGDRYIRVEE